MDPFRFDHLTRWLGRAGCEDGAGTQRREVPSTRIG
jgi:hypothetical protein